MVNQEVMCQVPFWSSVADWLDLADIHLEYSACTFGIGLLAIWQMIHKHIQHIYFVLNGYKFAVTWHGSRVSIAIVKGNW